MTATQLSTVLVVDDDAGWRVVVERWLKREGMRVIGLARGEWIAHAIERHRPDVVLLDVHLPGLDGLQVLEVVRHRWPTLPIIVMTAFGGRETAELVRRLGANGYLDKPFRMDHLVAELTRMVQGHDSSREQEHEATGDGAPPCA
jgi:DNA-binding response OmpR family regulator